MESPTHERLGVSQARAQMKRIMDSVLDHGVLVEIDRRGEDDAVMLLSKSHLKETLAHYQFTVDFLPEAEDGSMSVWLAPLNIGENGRDAREAFAKLREAARDYARHYLREWDYYKLFENTRSLRPYVERILLASTDDELTGIVLS